MAALTGGRDPYLLRGAVVMAAVAALYLSRDRQEPLVTGVFAALFAVGAIVALASPARWSVRTTLRLYRAVPLLVGVSTLALGGHALLTADVPVLAAVLVGWGVLSLGVLVFGPWREVESYLEQVNARETEAGRAFAPLPPRLFQQLRYAGLGLLAVTAALVGARLVVEPDFGTLAVLAGGAGAGFVNVWCSPYSGPPERVVRLRQARWAILGVGTAAASTYGALVANTPVGVLFWGTVTFGVGYLAVVKTSWDEVRDAVADARANLDGRVD